MIAKIKLSSKFQTIEFDIECEEKTNELTGKKSIDFFSQKETINSAIRLINLIGNEVNAGDSSEKTKKQEYQPASKPPSRQSTPAKKADEVTLKEAERFTLKNGSMAGVKYKDLPDETLLWIEENAGLRYSKAARLILDSRNEPPKKYNIDEFSEDDEDENDIPY